MRTLAVASVVGWLWLCSGRVAHGADGPAPSPPPLPPPSADPGPTSRPAVSPGGPAGVAAGSGLPEVTFDAPEVRVRAVEPIEIAASTAAGGVPLTYPGGRDVLVRQILDSYPANATVEVVRRVPGVYSQVENAGGWRLHVGVRGSDARRSGFAAVLVDGVPVNPAPYGSIDLDVFPLSLERVDRIDVIRGGAQVRYGPSSVGGVFNFITHALPERGSELTCSSGFGSWNQWSEYVVAGADDGTWGGQATAVVRGGDGWREHSAYRTGDYAAKLRFRPDGRTTISGAYSYYDLAAEEANGLPQAAYEADPSRSTRTADRIDATVGIGSLSVVHRVGCDTTVSLLGYAYDQFRSFDTLRPVVAPYDRMRFQTAFFADFAIEARLESSGRLGGREHRVYASLRYADESNHLYYHAIPLAGGPPILPHEQNNDFYTNAISAFAEDVIELSPSLHAALGARFEHIAMGGRNRDTRLVNDATHDIMLPAASLTWEPRPGSAIYASYQESFTPAQFDSFDPSTVAFRPIDPERARTCEVGGRTRLRGFEGAIALFDTEYFDKITILNDPNGLKVYSNTGRERHYGVELSGRFDLGSHSCFEGASLYATWTEMRATILNGPFEGNDAPGAPRHLGSWGVEYRHPCNGIWARLGGTFTGAAFKEAANLAVGSANGVSGPQPEFTLWDAAIGWQARPDATGFSAQIGVTNLFDEKYYRRFALGIYPGEPTAVYGRIAYTLAW
jgi:Fe(3+) dicitrate transport protein